jgi:hypothetical protein
VHWCHTSGAGPAVPYLGHDVACSSLHLDLFQSEAEVRCKAGFSAGKVAAHSGMIEEQSLLPHGGPGPAAAPSAVQG